MENGSILQNCPATVQMAFINRRTGGFHERTITVGNRAGADWSDGPYSVLLSRTEQGTYFAMERGKETYDVYIKRPQGAPSLPRSPETEIAPKPEQSSVMPANVETIGPNRWQIRVPQKGPVTVQYPNQQPMEFGAN